MLHLQVIVVDKAPALAEIVDVLIHQYAGVKSRLIMLRKCPMNRIPQQSCQEAGSVIVLSPRHDAGKLHSQPAFRSDLNRDRKTGVTTYFGNLPHGRQRCRCVLPELDGCVLRGADSL